jgi:hypothetical protein
MGNDFGGSAHPHEREALYRENALARLAPRRLAPEEIDDQTSVAVLGLEQGTISRLHRCGIVRLRELLAHPAEDLWRTVGRHGITDILTRLECLGIEMLPLSDQARWRLGLLPKEAAVTPLDSGTPVADLWPRLGVPLVDALQKRNLLRLEDLAPDSDEAVLHLYRLGRANLRRIRELLEQAVVLARGDARARLEDGIALIRAREQASRRDRGDGATAPFEPPTPVRRRGGHDPRT